MSSVRRKGYIVERKIKKIFESHDWHVIRAGGSLGEADLVCFKNGKCFFVQVKSTRKKVFYYYDYPSFNLAGFPFYVIVDFGYGKIRVVKPKKIIKLTDGISLEDFLLKY